MHITSYIAALVSLVSIRGLALAIPLASPYASSRSFQKHAFSRRDLNAHTVQLELGPLLSNTSTIFGPDSPKWANATHRFNIFSRPDVEVIAVPGKEADVSTIVKYCNDNSIDFFAYNRGHGLSTSIRKFKGLQINLEQLNAMTIAKDGKSVVVQGGMSNGDATGALWEQGYVATVGTASCVGLLGAGLGGGHGAYEGQYGLVADNFIHLNVVLADGSAIGVNATSHSDLFWAMKGAGHNYGIVTSAELKLYPRKIDTWHYHNYWWTGDKLEAVFQAVNEFHASDDGTTPPLMGLETGAISMNTSVSQTEATLFWSFGYAGPAEEAEKLLAPFNAIKAAGESSGDVPFTELSNALANGGEAGVCTPQRWAGSSTVTGPYNITTQRRLYDLFNKKAAEYPELAAASRLFNEGYSTKAVEGVPSDSTAYPHRSKKHIIFFLSALAEGSKLQATAEQWAKEIWDLWLEGEGPGARSAIYVNYALGTDYETREAIYGDEKWRLQRLVDLKHKYDPYNRFRYFVPILS